MATVFLDSKKKLSRWNSLEISNWFSYAVMKYVHKSALHKYWYKQFNYFGGVKA